MILELILRWAHVIGAAVLLGTGAGIAFFMLMAHRTRDARLIAHVSRTVVIADWIFTASAVVIQPITGLWLAHLVGWPISEGWVVASLSLYVMVGVFWLPVVWIQHRLHSIAQADADTGDALPAGYFRLFRIWFACGFPAFAGVLAILWLMVARPSITLF